MTALAIGLAVVAGVVSFASPCCLPLVPAYVGYMVGVAPADVAASQRRMAALRQALFFVLGFSAVFIALWASVGLVGYLLRDHLTLLREIGGALLVFMGLHVAGAIDIGLLWREAHLPIGPYAHGGVGQAPDRPSYARSAMLGVVFAAGWTPCVGPILGGIIGLASVSDTVAEGTVLLLAYATGLAIPFVLVAMGATSVSDRLGWLRDHHRAVSIVTGVMLIGVGLLMFTNTFARLSRLVPQFGV